MLFSKKQHLNTDLISKDIFVLVCGGSGITNLISAEILLVVEDELRMQGSSVELAHLFDLYASSSTGTLITNMLQSINFCTRDIIDFFNNHYNTLFVKNQQNISNDVLREELSSSSLYSSSILQNELEKLFGTIKFSELSKPNLVPLLDIHNLEPYVADSSQDMHVGLNKVIMASISTPKLFSPVIFTSKDTHDEMEREIYSGSLYSMSSKTISLIVWSWLMNNIDNVGNIHILSIDTGMSNASTQNFHAYFDWVGDQYHNLLIQLIQQSNATIIGDILNKQSNIHVYDIDGFVDDSEFPMHDSSPQYLEFLHIQAINIIHKNRLKIKKFVAQLLKK